MANSIVVKQRKGKHTKTDFGHLLAVSLKPFTVSLPHYSRQCVVTAGCVAALRNVILQSERQRCPLRPCQHGWPRVATAALFVTRGSRYIMSANDTLSCSHYVVWLAGKLDRTLCGMGLLVLIGCTLISVYVLVFFFCVCTHNVWGHARVYARECASNNVAHYIALSACLCVSVGTAYMLLCSYLFNPKKSI